MNTPRDHLGRARIHWIRALFILPLLVMTPLRAQAHDCSISGPEHVSAGQSFTLCGPKEDGARYEWSGPGVHGENERCLEVNGLSAGSYKYTLTFKTKKSGGRGNGGWEEQKCTHTVRVTGGGGGPGTCTITGPSTVDAGEKFQLCGPSDIHGSTYSWQGQGIESGRTSRCVTIDDLDQGTYTYTLTVNRNGERSTCTHQVRVENGDVSCTVSGPTEVAAGQSFQLCGPTGSGLTYEWSGGANLPSDKTTRCVTIAPLTTPSYYTFYLEVTQNGSSSTCMHVVRVNGNGTACVIDGPDAVKTSESFTLCGPTGNGLTYEWSGGANLPSNKTTRCVSITPISGVGSHTYMLRVTQNGTSTTCTHTVMVETGAPCSISGPTQVQSGQQFQLCGPTGTGLTYEWSGGSGLPSIKNTRCVMIPSVQQGTHTYTLRVTQNGNTSTCTHTVSANSGAGACVISGPSTVREGEKFTLCGPHGDGLFYSWDGPELPDDSFSRCLVIDGLSEGTYRYTLEIDDEETFETCTFDVHVTGDGEMADACPRPLSFWKQVCKKDKSWRDDLEDIAECLDDHAKWLDVDDGDWDDLCDLLRDNDSGMKNRLKRQIAVTLVNVCARDLGLRDGSHRIGLDRDMAVHCKWVDGKTLDDLIDEAEKMVGGRHATSSGSPSRTRMARAAYCLSKINRGQGFECEGEEDDEDRALAAAAQEEEDAELAGQGLELERPTPNPFAVAMRMRYAVDAGGAQVRIGVYDIAGRLIQRLADGARSAGVHEVVWDGAGTDGTRAMPGMYFVRGSIGTRPVTARVMFVK